MLVTASNGAAGLPPKMPKEVGQDVEVLSTKRVSQPPYGGSAGGKAVGRKQKGVTSPVPPSVSAPRNVAESLKDPWINLPRQEQQQQPHQIPGSVVQNTVPQRRPSQPEAYSRPMSQQSQHPLPQQPQHHQSSPQQQFYQPPSSHQFQSQQQQYQNPAIMNLPSGQNLLDLLRGGPSSASTAAPIPHSSKPETPAPIAQTQHTQIAGAQSPLQSLSGQPSLMDILKGVAGSSSGGGGGGGGPLQGGFGGVISGNGGMGGGGGGGLGAGFFSAAMSKNSVTTVGTHDSSANADALRSILGIGKKPQ
ncbi:hypothetical protein BC830DRAFT_1176057 [Chytriomyces sp. MP71]|nr:hypothetical protein BC830DRAFT_1176057 [Chytriomyces sp. MP71]